MRFNVRGSTSSWYEFCYLFTLFCCIASTTWSKKSAMKQQRLTTVIDSVCCSLLFVFSGNYRNHSKMIGLNEANELFPRMSCISQFHFVRLSSSFGERTNYWLWSDGIKKGACIVRTHVVLCLNCYFPHFQEMMKQLPTVPRI